MGGDALLEVHITGAQKKTIAKKKIMVGAW
jgi:hypothetical protein